MNAWTKDALCAQVGAELFFPPDTDDSTNTFRYDDARTVCAACTVRDACLNDAMAREGNANHEHRAGMYGGLTPNQRTTLARRSEAPA